MLDSLVAFELEHLTALGSIILIDIVLSGDNAIVIGMAVAGLPLALRRRAIVIGVLLATALRIAFAVVVVELLAIVGLLLAGGILLLWVCWRMWRDLRNMREASGDHENVKARVGDRPPTTMRQALTMIVVADVSMSLDNVLAVGGAAQGHHGLLIFGPGAFDRAHGLRGQPDRRAAAPTQLDRLCRARRHHLCIVRHDLARNPRDPGGRESGVGERERVCDRHAREFRPHRMSPAAIRQGVYRNAGPGRVLRDPEGQPKSGRARTSARDPARCRHIRESRRCGDPGQRRPVPNCCSFRFTPPEFASRAGYVSCP